MRCRYIDDDRRRPSRTFKLKVGRRLSPEHEEILRRVRRQQLEETLRQSAERRREWGLPPLDYGLPPT